MYALFVSKSGAMTSGRKSCDSRLASKLCVVSLQCHKCFPGMEENQSTQEVGHSFHVFIHGFVGITTASRRRLWNNKIQTIRSTLYVNTFGMLLSAIMVVLIGGVG